MQYLTTTETISIKGELFKITLIDKSPKVPTSLKLIVESGVLFINYLKN